MKLPKTPTAGASIMKWAVDAVVWMRANTIHNVIGGKLKRTPNGITIDLTPQNKMGDLGYVHPWKVTPNGDNTVTVAPGNVLDFSTSSNGLYDAEPVTGAFTAYAGGDVTIGASGTLYAVVTYTIGNIIANDTGFTLATNNVRVSSVTVTLTPTLTTNELSIPIAEVTLSGGVAAVTNQILTHNPVIQLCWAEGYI